MAKTECLTATARDVFALGDRVQLTTAGRNVNPRGPSTGTVVGFGRHGYILRVLRDGNRQPASYHRLFWENVAWEPEAATDAGPS